MAPNVAIGLREFILREVSRRKSETPSARGLTVGLEHEFFLLGADGQPASHELSQLFLKNLGLQPGWYVRETSTTASGEGMIWRCSEESTEGRFTAVKYDHHPHLMEIAFPYERDLKTFAQSLHVKFKALEQAARDSGCVVWNRPHLPLLASDPRVTSTHQIFEKLRHYRGRLFDKRNEPRHSEHVNYAAVIAATQTHIGGAQWWNRQELVESLYCIEPFILEASSAGMAPAARQESLQARWEGYQTVFKGYPLVGFPSLSRWTFEQWIDALLNSPLAGSPYDAWSGKTTSEHGRVPYDDWAKAFPLIRDLQIVRPRLFGTLEFRADAAQTSVDRILGLMALRLGSVAAKLTDAPDAENFQSAKRNWWELVTGERKLSGTVNQPLLDVAHAALVSRGYGEEVFLNVFSEI